LPLDFNSFLGIYCFSLRGFDREKKKNSPSLKGNLFRYLGRQVLQPKIPRSQIDTPTWKGCL